MLLPRPAALGSALAVFALLVPGPAHAGFIPLAVTVTPDHGNFRWSYAVALPSYTRLEPGNYFAIYDFNGLIPGAAGAPAGWTVSTPTVGPTPAHTSVFDSAAVPNLVWTYHGRPRTGAVRLGEFWAASNSGTSEDGLFVGRNARSWDGKGDTNITETKIPTPAPGVPEPGTFVLAGVGLSLLGVARRVRRSWSDLG